MKLLLIDNYDSFTFNLYHLIANASGVEIDVKRNDDEFLTDIEHGVYDGIVVSPGPGSPEDKEYFGQCMQVITDFGTKGLPILGVCLGFQGIAYAFGASLRRAPLPMHGKLSDIEIVKNDNILKDVGNHASVMRYHSIIVDISQPIPDDLTVTSYVADNAESTQVNGQEIMSIEHKNHQIYGIQFHPESFATEFGEQIIKNYIDIVRSS